MDSSERSPSDTIRSFLSGVRRWLWVGAVLVLVGGLAVMFGWSRGWLSLGPNQTSPHVDPFRETKTAPISNLQVFSPERIVWSMDAPDVEREGGILSEVLQIFQHKKNLRISDVEFSPTGDRVLAGVSPGWAKLWNASSGVLLQTFPHGGNFPSVAFSPSGDRVLTGKPTYRDVKSEAKLWDASTGEHLQTLPHENGVLAVAFSPSGERVLTGRESPRGKESEAKLWDASTGELLRSFSHPGDVRAVAFSPTGDKILTGGLDRVRLWSVSGDLVQTFSQPQSILDAELSPTGDRVLTGGNDGTRLWKSSSGELLQTFKLKRNINVKDVAFSPTGDRVLTEGGYGAHLWSVSTGEVLQTFPHSESVDAVAFSPSGNRILTASYDTVRLWRIPSRKQGLARVQEEVHRRLEAMKAHYTALPDTLIAGQRQLLHRKRTLQKSAPEHPEVPVVTCGETVSQQDCQKRKQTARSRYETKRKAFRQAFDTYTDKIRPLNQTIALVRERMYRFYENRIKPRMIHKTFLRVFGDPRLTNVRYDADRQTYLVDLRGSRSTAEDYKRTLAVQTSRDTVTEDERFKKRLKSSSPVVQWNITTEGVEWDTAWVKLDQKRLILMPVEDSHS